MYTKSEIEEKYKNYSLESLIDEVIYLAGSLGKDHQMVREVKGIIYRRLDNYGKIY